MELNPKFGLGAGLRLGRGPAVWRGRTRWVELGIRPMARLSQIWPRLGTSLQSVQERSVSIVTRTGAIVLLAVLPGLTPARSAVSGPAQIVLIRHAEKPADPTNPHLSPAGVNRAERLVAFIKTDPT